MNRFAFVVLCGITATVAAQEATPRFEVVSVKPLPAGSNIVGYRPEPTRFSAYFSVIDAIAFAYQIPQNRIVEGPQWAREQR